MAVTFIFLLACLPAFSVDTASAYSSLNGFSSPQGVTYGDADCNGCVTVTDVTITVQEPTASSYNVISQWRICAVGNAENIDIREVI